MKFCKLMVFSLVVCLIMFNVVAQETVRSDSDVESLYLDSTESVIINSLAIQPDYESKLLALQYIQDAIEGGSMNPAIEATLHVLVGEGIFTESRVAGRITNNYPDVRLKASQLLAQSPTEETKDILVDLIKADNEPMVVAAAIQALGEIGINTNDEVVEQISAVHRRFSILNPSDSLAYSVLSAFEKLAPTVEDASSLTETIASIASNYSYVLPIRQKAKDLLDTLVNNN